MQVCIFFFFSSRRRHTRLVSDWSSDVCSSDLISPGGLATGGGNRRRSGTAHGRTTSQTIGKSITSATNRDQSGEKHIARSEERRVGKECRCRWWPDEYKKERRRHKRSSECVKE